MSTPHRLPDALSQAALHIQGSVPRLLALQDRDPLSPSFGSFDASYWRDKGSDVQDARYQEAVATLALLWSGAGLPEAMQQWRGRRALLDACCAGVRCWIRAQYAEGCFDGWYRGERSFSVTASSTLALAVVRLTLGTDHLPADLRVPLDDSLRRAARWLSHHAGYFRSHQTATAVAALTMVHRATGDEAAARSAARIQEKLLTLQTAEGWFPEIGDHADIGNTFQLLDFLALHAQVSDDWGPLAQLERAFDFARNYVHPGPTTGTEYGVSHDGQVGRLGIVLLAGKIPQASRLLQAMHEPVAVPKDAEEPAELLALKGLLDDRGLCRRSLPVLLACQWFQTLAPSIDANRVAWEQAETGPPESTPLDWVSHPGAGLIRVDHGGRRTIIAPVAGGLVRSFQRRPGHDLPGLMLLEDAGYRLQLANGGTLHVTPRFDPKAPFTVHPGNDGVVIEMQVDLLPLRYFFPTYWGRFALRLACLTAWSARLTHRYINRFRRKAATALIENAPPQLIKGRPLVRLDRFVSLGSDGRVEVDDKLTNLTLDPIELAAGALQPLCMGPAGWREGVAEAIAAAEQLQPGVPLTTFRESAGDAS